MRVTTKNKPYFGVCWILAEIRPNLLLTCGSGRFVFSVVSPFAVLAVSPLFRPCTLFQLYKSFEPNWRQPVEISLIFGLYPTVAWGVSRGGDEKGGGSKGHSRCPHLEPLPLGGR